VLTSVVSAGYYLRIVRAAFFLEPEGEGAVGVKAEPLSAIAIAFTVLVTVALGVAAGPVLAWLVA